MTLRTLNEMACGKVGRYDSQAFASSSFFFFLNKKTGFIMVERTIRRRDLTDEEYIHVTNK